MKIEFHSNKNENFDAITFVEALIYQKAFGIDELEEIAEYLLIYCKHNKEEGAK